VRTKIKDSKTLHRARIVASSALAGAVIGGAFFGWLPAIGILGIHELGALVGAGVGVIANAKHLV
jgi:uncharacterized membrane protein